MVVLALDLLFFIALQNPYIRVLFILIRSYLNLDVIHLFSGLVVGVGSYQMDVYGSFIGRGFRESVIFSSCYGSLESTFMKLLIGFVSLICYNVLICKLG